MFMHQARARSKLHFESSMVLYSMSAMVRLLCPVRLLDNGHSAAVVSTVMLKLFQSFTNSSLMNSPPLSKRIVSSEPYSPIGSPMGEYFLEENILWMLRGYSCTG